jgi:hypothetical protein
MQTVKIEDFAKGLEDTPETHQDAPQQAVSRPKPTNGDYVQRKARAMLYAATVEGIPEGSGRKNKCYELGAAVREKFGFTGEDLKELLQPWNDKNSPPLTDAVLADIVENVNRYAKKAAGSGYEPTKKFIKTMTSDISDNCFNEFIPLDKSNLPEFPLHCLPETLQYLTYEIAESLNVPAELPGMLSLGAVSLVSCGRYAVQPKPDWNEPVNLYIAVVMPPASKKSAVFSITTEPIKAIEQELIESSREKVERNKSDFAILEKKKSELEKKLTKDGFEDRITLDRILREIAEFKHLYEPTLIAGDVTPEAVVKLLSQNNGKLGIFSSEGGLFATFAGRYQDNKPVNDAFLAGHIGDSIKVNRVGRPSEFIENPSITMALTIQPTILEHLGHKRLLEDTGLLGRFLYAMPCGGQPASFQTPAITEAVKVRYSNVLKSIYQKSANLRILRMCLESTEKFEGFYNETQKRIWNGDLTSISSWAGKLCGHTLRIAAIFQLVECAEKGDFGSMDISEKNIINAIKLSNYLIPHAKKAFQQLGKDESLRIAEKIVLLILRGKHEIIKQRDIFESIKGMATISTVSDILPSLEILIENGYLRRIPAEDKVGRKSIAFEVNPLCF